LFAYYLAGCGGGVFASSLASFGAGGAFAGPLFLQPVIMVADPNAITIATITKTHFFPQVLIFLLLFNSYLSVRLLYRTDFNYPLSMPVRQYARKLLCRGLIDCQV
jgi:hypothetical protein